MASRQNPRRRSFGYTWDDNVARYRQRGQFVAQRDIERVLQDRIDEGIDRLEDNLAALLEEGADLQEWQLASVVELRRAHTQSLAYGRGGWDKVTFQEWGELGARLKDEYRLLNDFSLEIAAGELSEAQIRDRMNQFAEKSWNGFWEGQTKAKKDAGFVEERRVLDPSAEHCDDCLRLAALGWQPIGTLPEPADGSTRCKSRDKCSKVYRTQAEKDKAA